MPFEIIRDDITKLKVDAIVNSANPHAIIGAGVDQAIHKAAGAKLLEARKEIGDIVVGQASATLAFNLHAKYVIHTVGPIWTGGFHHVIELVKQCYLNSLKEALKLNCESIAFPLISTGTYGFPKDQALAIAISVISEFVLLHEVDVYLVVYDRQSYEISEKLFNDVTAYIDDHYVGKQMQVDYFNEDKSKPTPRTIRYSLDYSSVESEIPSFKNKEDLLDKLTEFFSETLLRLIDLKGFKDVEIYQKANISRKHFSKIRSNKDCKPSKITTIAFAIALELTLDETKAFLETAGFALTHSSIFDVIIEFFIREGNCNVFEINEVLFGFDQTLLGQ